MVNVILMITNLLAVYMLCLTRVGRPGKGVAEGGSYRKPFAWKAGWLLEFAVYGAGMIRLADLIIQGITGPGSRSRALFAVRIMLAECMLPLFPLWKVLYSGHTGYWEGREADDKTDWNTDKRNCGMYWNRGGRDCGTCRNGGGRDCGACQNGGGKEYGVYRNECERNCRTRINPEFLLSLFLLLGLTLQAWRETEQVKAFWLQTGYLLLFFGFEYLNERRNRKENVENYLREAERRYGFACAPGGSLEPSYAGKSREAGYGYRGWRRGEKPAGAAVAENEVVSIRCGHESSMEGLQHRRQVEYLRGVEQQYQRTRELWHDLKNHIKILEILAGEERFDELTDYLDSFKRDVERRMIPTKTGCAAVDALLGDKLYQAGKQGTKMTLQLCDLSEMRLQSVDLCVILGNLLDNALEACARIPEEGCISLRLKQEDDFYYLRVVNTAEAPVKKGQQYVSGKGNRDNGVGHGLGLRSAERLAHQYGGSLVTDYSDGTFTVVVRLQAS